MLIMESRGWVQRYSLSNSFNLTVCLNFFIQLKKENFSNHSNCLPDYQIESKQPACKPLQSNPKLPLQQHPLPIILTHFPLPVTMSSQLFLECTLFFYDLFTYTLPLSPQTGAHPSFLPVYCYSSSKTRANIITP